ncbi:MAG: hypothetical protein OEZ22_01265 [Spirochaetia bacterium]|nr:hypothetical protein [Spirochaetia bacterium]
MKNLKNKTKIIAASIVSAGMILAVIHHLHSGHDHSHDHSAPAGEMTLNDGKKWKADNTTKKHISSMRETVEGAIKKENLSAETYKKTGAALSDIFNQILQDCTMTGRDHEELHKFLMTLNIEIENLKKDDLTKAEASLKEADNKLLLFDKYFE